MNQIEISQLPPPEVVTQLDAKSILERMLARYAELSSVGLPKVGDPIYNAYSSMAEEVTRARQEFQDISLENMVAYASGKNLQRLADWRDLEKFPTESDDEFRRRVQMAPEGFSTAGPDGAYIFHALAADENVLDARPLSPDGFKVDLFILSREGSGVASADLCERVFKYVSKETKRPLNDELVVKSAEISSYRIVVELELPQGPGEQETLALAEKRLASLAAETHKLGGKVTLSLIDAAAHVQNDKSEKISFQPVIDVNIIEPTASVLCNLSQAPYCSEIIVRQKAQ
ncbi:phage-related baseplate assembly protein [Vibrio vulnificus]|uniref:baseplate assembly protein n=1 Tax=Vibrio vulnificus TaxID=672 RepID=UPI0009B62DDB|nr:baseplate J/gp47 family protein [Vibrio vulnificus]OQK44016.1 phage-related baseplate assembly protein [Vibrio vulnificus]